MRRETTAEDVARYLDLPGELGITVWLDSGWGVGVLLGEQTRQHSDRDIVIEQRKVHDSGNRVDFHVIVIDNSGRGIYGPPE